LGTRRIGTAYLQFFPAEASQSVLLNALTPIGKDPNEWWASIDLAGLQKAIRRQVHKDFGTPDVVVLDGWELARSEVRLAALWVVTHP